MRILICMDDTDDMSELKEDLLSYECDEELLFESFDNVESATYRLRFGEFDMAFVGMDIQEDDGVLLGKKIREKFPDCFLFFQSQNYERMNEVFEVKAFQFLIKGNKELLKKNFIRAMDVHHQRNLQLLFLTVDLERRYFIPEEILYMETGKAPSKLVTVQSTYYGEFDQMGSLKKQLIDYHFFQVHQNFFVNLRYVACVHRGEIVMKNGDVVPTSTYNKVFVDEALHRYINS